MIDNDSVIVVVFAPRDGMERVHESLVPHINNTIDCETAQDASSSPLTHQMIHG